MLFSWWLATNIVTFWKGKDQWLNCEGHRSTWSRRNIEGTSGSYQAVIDFNRGRGIGEPRGKTLEAQERPCTNLLTSSSHVVTYQSHVVTSPTQL